MVDYCILYKNILKDGTDWSDGNPWDLFISAYNSSERVNHVYNNIAAKKKQWVTHAEYCYSEKDCPEDSYNAIDFDEAKVIQGIFNHLKLNSLEKLRICIDITGFMRPNMMFMLLYIKHLGAKKVDIIYAEPSRYIEKEKTVFSIESSKEVKQVAGFEGQHNIDNNNDILIIGTGYDHQLIAQVAESKENARKIQIYGFPSLSADMYQENILRVHKASESLDCGPGGNHPDNYFAPANDPFVTANILHEIVENVNNEKKITNLYLCPIGTKVQALGFAIFYLTECVNTATSIIFPFFEKYTKETSKGHSRIWKYSLEFL